MSSITEFGFVGPTTQNWCFIVNHYREFLVSSVMAIPVDLLLWIQRVPETGRSRCTPQPVRKKYEYARGDDGSVCWLHVVNHN